MKANFSKSHAIIQKVNYFFLNLNFLYKLSLNNYLFICNFDSGCFHAHNFGNSNFKVDFNHYVKIF
jgi:hypothetical protein